MLSCCSARVVAGFAHPRGPGIARFPVRCVAAGSAWRHSDDVTVDLAVVGGGVMGVWAAIRAAERGASVVLADQFDPGHDRGSSHGDGRIYRLAYEEAHYVSMMRHSLPMWRRLQEHAGHPLMAETGGVNIDRVGSDKIARMRAGYLDRGIEHQLMSAPELNDRFPQYGLGDEFEALFQPEFGVLFATKCVVAGWDYAVSLGVATEQGFRLESVTRDTDQGQRRQGGRGSGSDTVLLRGSDGRAVRAKATVIAPGGWLTGLSERLFGVRIPTRVSAETVCYFAPKVAAAEVGVEAPLLERGITSHFSYGFLDSNPRMASRHSVRAPSAWG